MKEHIARRSKLTAPSSECPRAERKFILHLLIVVISGDVSLILAGSAAARFSIEFHRLTAHLGVDELVVEGERVGIECGARCRVKFQFLSQSSSSSSWWWWW